MPTERHALSWGNKVNANKHCSHHVFLAISVLLLGRKQNCKVSLSICTLEMHNFIFLGIHRPPLWSSGHSSWLQIGDVLCFLWGTNWIYICYVEESRPPLWSSVQSSWLHNGDVLCLLWGTNWIYICYVEESWPPLWSSGQSSWLRIGDVLCFLWGTNWIYICYVEESRPPLWSSGQSSWLQIQKSRVLFPTLPHFLRSSGSG
jgi:hypothetical protein